MGVAAESHSVLRPPCLTNLTVQMELWALETRGSDSEYAQCVHCSKQVIINLFFPQLLTGYLCAVCLALPYVLNMHLGIETKVPGGRGRGQRRLSGGSVVFQMVRVVTHGKVRSVGDAGCGLSLSDFSLGMGSWSKDFRWQWSWLRGYHGHEQTVQRP